MNIASNAFREDLKILSAKLDIDLDQIVLDLFGFFKCSPKRIWDYFDVAEFTDIQRRRILKHLSTQRISIHDFLIRVLEQFSKKVTNTEST